LGLNEVSIQAGTPFSVININLYVDSELATTYSCDGLIVSTPVGSTAHSLSAGGPILRQSMSAFVVVPLCPHTLTNRPVVDTADRVYELEVPHPNPGSSVIVDGRVLGEIIAGDRVRVEQAAARFKLVTGKGHGYYRTLREKLGWGGQLQNRKT
jgi:NAD+ kinase